MNRLNLASDKNFAPPAEPAPVVATKPSPAEKAILKLYVENIKSRGFCKHTSSVSRDTQLFNRFDCALLPMSFLAHDFDNWLHETENKCAFRSTQYIARTLTHVIGSKFVPIDAPYFKSPQSGCIWVNTYTRHKPALLGAEISPLLLEFWDRLWPIEAERHTALQWLSHIFQRPQERPSWHLMLPSVAGIGKGFLVQDILHPLLKHTTVIGSFSKLTGQFSTVIEDNLLVLLDDCKAKTQAVQTTLKSLLSEERAYVERKQQQGRMVDTYVRFILASNEEKPLHLDDDERRWFVCSRLAHRQDTIETQRFIQKLSDWLELAGSLDAVFNWFMAYDLTEFNPKHVEQSAALKSIIQLSKNIHEQVIEDFIADNKVFSNAELMEAFSSDRLSRPSDAHVSHILTKLRYKRKQVRLASGSKSRLCYPDGMEVTEIRALWKAPGF